MHDIPLTETDFHVTVTVLNSNRLPTVQGWGPLSSWYRVEDGTEQNTMDHVAGVPLMRWHYECYSSQVTSQHAHIYALILS